MYRKGYMFERALKQNLEEEGWHVIRSGGSKKPDLIAAKDGKIMVIECKATEKDKVYLDKEEVFNLRKVAASFGAEGRIAVKQNNRPWKLITLEQLKDSGKNFVVELL